VRAELRRLRLENETLSGVVGVMTSSPDLSHVLDRVVDLLSKATDCHACFVYLLVNGRLRLRAASPMYAHLVGHIEFSADEGLAGWALRHRKPAFIRDAAQDDPRTNYVPELHEERFQSMVAVPIALRAGDSMGAVVLHTVAPREFDGSVINILSRSASLLAGAIENAQLYEEARLRIEALTRWSSLAQDIAGAAGRRDLYTTAVGGVRSLLASDVCRLYELDPERRLRLVASDPPAALDRDPEAGAADALLRMGEGASGPRAPTRRVLAEALALDRTPGAILAVPVSAGDERLGLLVVAGEEAWRDHETELLRAVGHLLAVALRKSELIDRLTEQNAARDLIAALARGDPAAALRPGRAAGFDLALPHAAFEVRPLAGHRPWNDGGEAIEAALRRVLPRALCEIHGGVLRGLVPTSATGSAGARQVLSTLTGLCQDHHVVVGYSDGFAGVERAVQALREAHDAARISEILLDGAGTLLFRDAGAYRYLIDALEDDGPQDHLQVAMGLVADYDRRRSAQLLLTLERYLANGGAYAPTARSLTIHVNTLRQRLERIQALTGLALADEDLLSLQLAIKLVWARERRGDRATGARAPARGLGR
jgi:GAF domain-containing protein